MKKFIYSCLLFSGIPLLIFIILHSTSNVILEDDCLNDDIKSKIAQLPIDDSKANIIIAGDSRAEYQLIPQLITDSTHYNVINIAVISGDIISTFYAIKKHYQCSKLIFVISASSFQINDGAIDKGYVSLKCFQKLTLKKRYILYKDNLPELFFMYLDLTKHTLSNCFNSDLKDYDQNIINKLGFHEESGKIKQFDNEMKIKKYQAKHSWYKNISNDGIRWNILKEVITEMSKMNSYFIIYQPPISPYWAKVTKNTFIDDAERSYSNKMDSLLNKYSTIKYYDFYMNKIEGLNDNMYYDYQHLNKNGAIIFSNKISKILNSNSYCIENLKAMQQSN